MVQIAAPASLAPTLTDPATPRESAAQELPAPPAEASAFEDAAELAGEMTGAADAGPASPPADPAAQLAEQAMSKPPAPPVSAASEAPSANWEAQAGIARYQLWVWCGAGVLAATAVIGLLIYGRSPDAAPAETSEASQPTSDAPAAETVADEQQQGVAPPHVDSTAASHEAAEWQGAEAAAEATSQLDGAPQQDDEPILEPSPTAAASAGVEAAVAPNIETSTTSTQAESRPTLRIDPLDLDPEGFDLSLLMADDGPPPSVVRNQTADASATVEAAAEPMQVAGPIELPRSRLDPNSLDQRQLPRAAELVARRLPSLHVDKMPLSSFLDLASTLSGAPVSVAFRELRHAGAAAASEVSVKGENLSLLEALTQAFAKLRLEPVVEETGIVLRRSGGDRQRTIGYPLDDLVSDEASTADLAALVRRFVAPGTWAEPGMLQVGLDKLTVTRRESTQYEILLFFERLRLVRSAPLRSGYPRSLLSGESPYLSLHEPLGAPTTFTFSQYTPLVEIVRHWRSELGMPILVDWPALGEVGLRPQSRIACNAANQPWRQALDEVLGPLNLAWTAGSGNTLGITSRRRATSQADVHFYPLADRPLGPPEELAKELARLAGEHGAVATYDAPGKTMIVRAAAPVHRLVTEALQPAR